MSIATPAATETKKCADLTRNLLVPFTCHICPFRSCEKLNLTRHFFNKHSLAKKNVKLTFPCLSCGRVFKGKAYLQTHILGNHSKTMGTKPYSCSECNIAFSTILELESHHLTHEYDLADDPNEFVESQDRKKKMPLLHCSKCSLGFESQEHLTKHQRRHIETISSSCDRDDTKVKYLQSSAKKKSNGSNINKNDNNKTKQKLTLIKTNASKIKAKYERSKKKKREKQQQEASFDSSKNKNNIDILYCPYCPSQFSNRYGVGTANLNIHVVMKHKDTVNEINPSTSLHKCPLCVKLFISKRSLKTHIYKKHDLSEEKAQQRYPYLYEGEDEQPNTSFVSTKQLVPVNFKQRKQENNLRVQYSSDTGTRKSYPERSVSPLKLASSSSAAEPATVRQPPLQRKLSAAQERKARLKERIRKRRAISRTQVVTNKEKQNVGAAVSDVSSSSSNDVNSASSIGSTSQQKRGRGRPPGPTKAHSVTAGRIAKKYRCSRCHLTYVTARSFNTHKKICKFKFQRISSTTTRKNPLQVESISKE